MRELQYVSGVGDIDQAKVEQTVLIDHASGTHTLFTPTAQQVFIAYQVWIKNLGGATATVVLRSGSTDLAKFDLAAGAIVNALNFGVPVLVGRAGGEALVLNTNQTLAGFTTVGTRKA